MIAPGAVSAPPLATRPPAGILPGSSLRPWSATGPGPGPVSLHDTGFPIMSLTHFNDHGHAHMVDVSDKPESARVAVAEGRVLAAPETIALIGEHGLAKGDVLAVARLAGIMGAKRTSDLIPLCHPLPLSSVTLALTLNRSDNAVEITATCSVTGRTGVEMEALTAVSVAALTVYDMCKSADKGMRIEGVRLVHKSGGRSGTFDAP